MNYAQALAKLLTGDADAIRMGGAFVTLIDGTPWVSRRDSSNDGPYVPTADELIAEWSKSSIEEMRKELAAGRAERQGKGEAARLRAEAEALLRKADDLDRGSK